MNIGKETRKVEFIYLFGAESKRELDNEINKYRKDKYELIKDHNVDYGDHIEYNARLMKVLDMIKEWFYL